MIVAVEVAVGGIVGVVVGVKVGLGVGVLLGRGLGVTLAGKGVFVVVGVHPTKRIRLKISDKKGFIFSPACGPVEGQQCLSVFCPICFFFCGLSGDGTELAKGFSLFNCIQNFCSKCIIVVIREKPTIFTFAHPFPIGRNIGDEAGQAAGQGFHERDG